jgi:hypothetical protein
VVLFWSGAPRLRLRKLQTDRHMLGDFPAPSHIEGDPEGRTQSTLEDAEHR